MKDIYNPMWIDREKEYITIESNPKCPNVIKPTSEEM